MLVEACEQRQPQKLKRDLGVTLRCSIAEIKRHIPTTPAVPSTKAQSLVWLHAPQKAGIRTSLHGKACSTPNGLIVQR